LVFLSTLQFDVFIILNIDKPRQTLLFCWHLGILRSPSLNFHGLVVYTKYRALAYANVSSYLSSIFLSPHSSYEPRVYSYFELSAFEPNNISICFHDLIFDFY